MYVDLDGNVIEYFNPVTRLKHTLDPTPQKLPDWLVVKHPEPPEPPRPSPAGRALLFKQCEMLFPRVIEMIYSGYTLSKALRELPIELDHGIFYSWLKKDPKRYELYKEAKEIRTEEWAGRIIDHAIGVDPEGNVSPEDTSRSKLIVDTYWKLMQAENRKQYGDTKSIELNTTISITAALQQAQQRVVDDAIEAEIVESPLELSDGEDED